MALNYVSLTCDLYDGSGNFITQGTASFAPSAQLTDTTDHELIAQAPIVVTFRPSGPPVAHLLATDNGNTAPSGWAWTVTFTGVPGSPASFSFFLPFTSGASQYLSAQAPVSSVVAMQAYMPLPTGTPLSGQVPVATGSGEGSAWGTVLDFATQSLASNYAGAGPYYAAHRGGGSAQSGIYDGPYPEEFIEGFRASVASGATIIGPHVRMTADGALVCMHDSTPDRTTTATGSINVASYTSAAWRQLTGTPQSWVGYGVNWGTIYPPFFSQVLQEFGGKVLIQAELDSANTAAQPVGSVGTAATALVQKYGLARNVMFSSFQAGDLTAPAAAGIATVYLPPAYGNTGYDAASITATMTAANGWGAGLPHHVGINAFGSTQANIVTYIGTLIAAGFKVWVYTVIRRSDVAWLQAAGVMGFVTDEPVYLPATAPVNTSGQDPTAFGVWPHGSLVNYNIAFQRGHLVNGGLQLDYVPNSGSQTLFSVAHGQLCPIVNAASTYTINATIVYDQLDADSTRWAGIYICCPDDSVTSGTVGQGPGIVNGYTVIVRQSGQIVVTKGNGGGTQTSSQVGSNQSTQAISAGQSVQLQIQVTPTTIVVTPTVNGTPYGPFTFTDSTYRGAYFHIGKACGSSGNRLICTFKNVTAA